MQYSRRPHRGAVAAQAPRPDEGYERPRLRLRGYPNESEPVRTLDGIHLATLLVLNTAAIDVDVLSCDSRVRENAEALGFRVLPAAE